MYEDILSIFTKYASLMNYIPTAPEERFAWHEKKYHEADERKEDHPDDHITQEDFFYKVFENEEDEDDFEEDKEDDENDEKDEL
jgi:hypothetical protein